MKKLILLSVLAVLCLFLKAAGQSGTRQRPLAIGDRLPELELTGVTGYTTDRLLTKTLRGKRTIIDFWATWCSPCVAMFPRTDSLQQQFSGKVLFLSVTYQPGSVALPFLERLKKAGRAKVAYPVITGDVQLHRLFPHRSLPHYVWLDEQGIVKRFTGHEEVNAAGIQNWLSGQSGPISAAREVKPAYDHNKPLYVGNNGGAGGPIVYRSLLTGYDANLNGGYKYDTYDPDAAVRKISCYNKSIAWLFRIAYAGDKRFFDLSKVVFEVSDTAAIASNGKRGQPFYEWEKGHTYCYELIVPAPMAGNIFEYMKADLARFFPAYHAQVEKRKVKALALVRTSPEDKLRSAGGQAAGQSDMFGFRARNAYLTYFTGQLSAKYMQHQPLPVVDATGYTGKVDLDITANLSSVSSVNEALGRYDLQLVEKEIEVELLVIKDQVQKSPSP